MYTGTPVCPALGTSDSSQNDAHERRLSNSVSFERKGAKELPDPVLPLQIETI